MWFGIFSFICFSQFDNLVRCCFGYLSADIICSGTGFSFPLIFLTCIFCYVSPKRQRWSDHDIDAVEPRLPEQTSLCVVWNVVLWPETLASAWASCGSNLVKDVLDLNHNFPDEFLQAKYVDVRFVGVPLEPGISPENRVYECFGISLVVIKHTRAFHEALYCQESSTPEQKMLQNFSDACSRKSSTGFNICASKRCSFVMGHQQE